MFLGTNHIFIYLFIHLFEYVFKIIDVINNTVILYIKKFNINSLCAAYFYVLTFQNGFVMPLIQDYSAALHCKLMILHSFVFRLIVMCCPAEYLHMTRCNVQSVTEHSTHCLCGCSHSIYLYLIGLIDLCERDE